APSSLPIGAEHLIDRPTRASDYLGDRRSSVALLVQVDDLGVVERHEPALVNAPGLGGFNAGALALSDEADLHLGNHPKHCQHHLADRALGRDLRFEHPKMRALALKLMNQVQHITRAAAKPVELDYDQSVTRADEIQNDRQFRAAVTRAAR